MIYEYPPKNIGCRQFCDGHDYQHRSVPRSGADGAGLSLYNGARREGGKSGNGGGASWRRSDNGGKGWHGRFRRPDD